MDNEVVVDSNQDRDCNTCKYHLQHVQPGMRFVKKDHPGARFEWAVDCSACLNNNLNQWEPSND